MVREGIEISRFGENVEGINFPVFNERAIRAAAGILFVFGFSTWMIAAITDDYQPLRAFGMAFLVDMFLRLVVSTRWVPSLVIANWIVRPQRPEWVDATPKRVAWIFGLGMALVTCMTMGLLNLTGPVPLVLCAFCISFLFIESAFGICVGCELARRFSKIQPRLCPGDVCNYTPVRR